MRKVIVSNPVSLDGFIAGPNGEIDRFSRDKELESYGTRTKSLRWALSCSGGGGKNK